MSINDFSSSTEAYSLTSTEDCMTSSEVVTDVMDSALSDVSGELSLLETNPQLAVPYVVLVSLAMIVGLTGHVMIITAYIMDKRLRVGGNEFIINLAVADICVTGFADPMCILGRYFGLD